MGQTLRGEDGVGPFQLLFETGGEFVTNLWMLYYDVSPDGERFLMIREAGPTGSNVTDADSCRPQLVRGASGACRRSTERRSLSFGSPRQRPVEIVWITQRGNVWWVAYCHRGKEFRESSKSPKENDARRLLKKRIGEIESRVFVGPIEEKLTFEQLVAGYLQDYDLRGLRSKDTAELHVKHLKSFFDDDERALNITTETIRDYQLHRLGEKAQGATINREVAALRRMFTIAAKLGQLQSAPPFPDRLEENVPRQGFFEHNEYLAIRKYLPPHYTDVLDFAYYTGWRKSEITKLTWGEVDLLGRCLRLDPKRSKNKDGRVLPLVGPLWQVIERRVRCRRIDTPYVFHYRGGRPVGDWRKTWKQAWQRAGLPGKLRHDCRRTAARNLIRAGVPESIAMQITGHKTRAVFDRYNIVNEKDLAEAATKLVNYVAGQPTDPEERDTPERFRTVFGQSPQTGPIGSP